MAATLSSPMIKAGGLASPHFSGFTACLRRENCVPLAHRSDQIVRQTFYDARLLALMMSTPISTSDEPTICSNDMLSCKNT